MSERYVFGDEHRRHTRRSSRHWNVEPRSLERKRNVARVAVVRDGGVATILLLGGTMPGGGGGGSGASSSMIVPLAYAHVHQPSVRSQAS